MAGGLDELLKQRAEYTDKNKRARLAYLYSDISNARSHNPAGFASACSWWSNLIRDIVGTGCQGGGSDEKDTSDKLVWHLDQNFADRLRWEGAGKPSCLGTVAIHMSQTKPAQILPLNAFMTSSKPIDSFSWPRWIASNLVGAPLWWSMGKLGLVDTEAGMPEDKAWKLAKGDWIMLDVVKRAGASAEPLLTGSTTALDRLFSRESFVKDFSSKLLPGLKLTTLDMEVLLKYLERDRKLLVSDKGIVKIIKIVKPQDNGPYHITEADRGILQVKETNAALEQQIADLEARIAERQAKIAGYLRSNQKDLALSHLRSKKAMLDLLSKRTMAQENLSAVLLKIEAAETDVAVVAAYQAATSSLKSLLSHPNLQREHIENTVDDLQEVLADQKEVDDMIADGGKQVSGADLYEDEIQEELNRLEEETRIEQEKKTESERVEKWQAATTTPVAAKSPQPEPPAATEKQRQAVAAS